MQTKGNYVVVETWSWWLSRHFLSIISIKKTNSEWLFHEIYSMSEFLETWQKMEELPDVKLSFKTPQNQSFVV